MEPKSSDNNINTGDNNNNNNSNAAAAAIANRLLPAAGLPSADDSNWWPVCQTAAAAAYSQPTRKIFVDFLSRLGARHPTTTTTTTTIQFNQLDILRPTATMTTATTTRGTQRVKMKRRRRRVKQRLRGNYSINRHQLMLAGGSVAHLISKLLTMLLIVSNCSLVSPLKFVHTLEIISQREAGEATSSLIQNSGLLFTSSSSSSSSSSSAPPAPAPQSTATMTATTTTTNNNNNSYNNINLLVRRDGGWPMEGNSRIVAALAVVDNNGRQQSKPYQASIVSGTGSSSSNDLSMARAAGGGQSLSNLVATLLPNGESFIGGGTNINNNSSTSISSNSNDDDGEGERHIIMGVIIANIVIFVIGLCGNAVVIVVILKFTRIETVTDIYILNLAFADLMFITGLVFLITTMFIDHWIFGNLMCKLYMATTSLNQFASSLLLVVMSFDRFLAVCHPIYAQRFRRLRRAKIICLCIWIVCLVLMTPIFAFAKINKELTCAIFWPDYKSFNCEMAFTLYSFAIGFAVPLLLIAAFYLCVIRKLRMAASGPIGSSGSSRRSRTRENTNRRIEHLVIGIICTYTVCWLPYWITQLCVSFMTAGENSPVAGFYEFFLIATSLSYTNSALNPILYAFLSDNFKRRCSEILRSIYSLKWCPILINRREGGGGGHNNTGGSSVGGGVGGCANYGCGSGGNHHVVATTTSACFDGCSDFSRPESRVGQTNRTTNAASIIVQPQQQQHKEGASIRLLAPSSPIQHQPTVINNNSRQQPGTNTNNDNNDNLITTTGNASLSQPLPPPPSLEGTNCGGYQYHQHLQYQDHSEPTTTTTTTRAFGDQSTIATNNNNNNSRKKSVAFNSSTFVVRAINDTTTAAKNHLSLRDKNSSQSHGV